MALTQLAPPYPIFTDKNGDPLDNGYLYFGEVNKNPETNPIQVYYDSAFTQPAAQPLRTSNGYVMRNGSPAAVYAGVNFSVTIRDKNNALVIYSPVGYGIDPAAAVTGSVTVQDQTGDGTTTIFGMGASPNTKNATNVYIDGVYQEKDTYSISGSNITFSEAPPLNAGIEIVSQESPLIGGLAAGQVSYNQGGVGAVNTTVKAKLQEFVSVKDFGAVGDYATDDTAAINAALSYAAPIGTSVFFPSGVYRYTGTLVLPVGVRLIGSGAPKIASFPQTGGDKNKLRPGYKDKISGSSIIFDGTGTLSTYTTNRSDKFASVVPMVLYDFYDPMDIHGIAFIQDMDVLTAGGSLTTSANDNRATAYTAGVVNTSTLSLETDLTVFGYFDDAGYILHNQDGDTIDPDYQTKTNCLITGGVAIIGHDTAAGAASEGLTGSRWTACGIYGADHHTRADGIYTVPCLYIDGKLGGGGSNTGIRGHSFGDCNFRTYANDSISLDNCNDAQFVNSVWEFSVLPGVPNADAGGGFVGTANTKDVTIVGGAGTSDPKLNTFLTQISGNYNVIGAGSFGGALFGQGGSAGVRVTGSSSTGDSYIQLTDDISSTATGWKMQRDAGTDNLDITYENAQIFSFSENGGIANGFGLASLGTQTIASGEITISNGSFYRVDTEASAATDDLTTITTTSAIAGHLLIIAAASSARTVVCKDGTGNLRLAGDFSLDNGQDRLMLMYDGTFWVEISRSDNTA